VVDVPHFALPLRLDGTGGFAVLEQDSVDDVAQCVAVVLATPVGSRAEAPTFGVPQVEFTSTVPAEDLVEAVVEWEPRADLDVDSVSGLGVDGTVTEITARVRARV
jgi:phage baseplate assembly protein W